MTYIHLTGSQGLSQQDPEDKSLSERIASAYLIPTSTEQLTPLEEYILREETKAIASFDLEYIGSMVESSVTTLHYLIKILGQWFNYKYGTKEDFITELRRLYRYSKPHFEAWEKHAKLRNLDKSRSTCRENTDS